MSNSKNTTRHVTLNIRLPQAERDRLHEHAKERGMTQSGVLREFIRALPGTNRPL